MMDIAKSLLFADGLLLRRHKEMIATLISSRNGCPYCADSHGKFLRALGGSDEVLCALQTGALDSASLSTAEQALLRVALQVKKTHNSSPELTSEPQCRQAGPKRRLPKPFTSPPSSRHSTASQTPLGSRLPIPTERRCRNPQPGSRAPID